MKTNTYYTYYTPKHMQTWLPIEANVPCLPAAINFRGSSDQRGTSGNS